MMNFETAVELKRLGFLQDTMFCYCPIERKDDLDIMTYEIIPFNKVKHIKPKFKIAFPVFEEIWKELLNSVKGYHKTMTFNYISYVIKEHSYHRCLPKSHIDFGSTVDNNLINVTEAAAKLWISLKQNNFI